MFGPFVTASLQGQNEQKGMLQGQFLYKNEMNNSQLFGSVSNSLQGHRYNNEIQKCTEC